LISVWIMKQARARSVSQKTDIWSNQDAQARCSMFSPVLMDGSKAAVGLGPEKRRRRAGGGRRRRAEQNSTESVFRCRFGEGLQSLSLVKPHRWSGLNLPWRILARLTVASPSQKRERTELTTVIFGALSRKEKNSIGAWERERPTKLWAYWAPGRGPNCSYPATVSNLDIPLD
jgi:hypothetical protein